MRPKVLPILYYTGGADRTIIQARMDAEIEERTGLPISRLLKRDANDIGGIGIGNSGGAINLTMSLVPDPDDPTKPRYTAAEKLESWPADMKWIFSESHRKPNMLKDRLESYQRRIERYRDGRIDRIAKRFGAPEDWISYLAKSPEAADMLQKGGLFYNTGLKALLKKRIGDDVKVGGALAHMMVGVTRLKAGGPMWIQNIEAHGQDTELTQDLPLWQAPYYSSLHPFGYDSEELKLPNGDVMHGMDGEFTLGSMPFKAVSDTLDMIPPDTRIILIVMGSGLHRFPYTTDQWNEMRQFERIMNVVRMAPSMADRACLAALSEFVLKNGQGEVVIFNDTINGDMDGLKHRPTGKLLDVSDENISGLIEWTEKRLITPKSPEIDRVCETLVTRDYVAPRSRLTRVFMAVQDFGHALKDIIETPGPRQSFNNHIPEDPGLRAIRDHQRRRTEGQIDSKVPDVASNVTPLRPEEEKSEQPKPVAAPVLQNLG